jgi:hypothetical protein
LGGIVHAESLSLGPATVLTVDLAGVGSASQQTQFFVDGHAMLGGGLQLMLGGYIPSTADMFAILSAAGGLTGTFTNIATGQRLNTSDGIGSFLVHYGSGSAFDPNQIVLTAFEPTGDYNGDGNFDAADYVLWRKHDGSQGGYNAWRANFGKSAGNGSASPVQVPEPTVLALGVCSFLSVAVSRRRRNHTALGLLCCTNYFGGNELCNTPMPKTAATNEADNTPNFAALMSSSSSNANCVTNSDIVKPMPARQLAP